MLWQEMCIDSRQWNRSTYLWNNVNVWHLVLFKRMGEGGWGVHRVWFIIPKGATFLIRSSPGPKLKNVCREEFEIQTKFWKTWKIDFCALKLPTRSRAVTYSPFKLKIWSTLHLSLFIVKKSNLTFYRKTKHFNTSNYKSLYRTHLTNFSLIHKRELRILW